MILVMPGSLARGACRTRYIAMRHKGTKNNKHVRRYQCTRSTLTINMFTDVMPGGSRYTCKQIIGIGTDGASANITSAGLKGLVEKELPWVFWMWCLAHRLELPVKDALKGTTFDLIDEMLLRLYCIYESHLKSVGSWMMSSWS